MPKLEYSKREDWSDVKPILNQDGPSPVCSIKYSDRCKYDISPNHCIYSNIKKTSIAFGFITKFLFFACAEFVSVQME